jgi:hypothetical protein
MISAAEAQLVGWPLPAWVVERTESIRKRVALCCSTFNCHKTGLSKAAPKAWDTLQPNSPPSWMEPGVSGVQ